MAELVVIDAPNLFNDVGRLLASSGRPNLSAYFRDWFDFDRLVKSTVEAELHVEGPTDLGIVIFHSAKSLGGDNDWALKAEPDRRNFWIRQATAPHTSTTLVDVPYQSAGKEKGVDIALVSYLFDTIDAWQTAIVFSSDADYVPAIWSMRRRGKRVFGAGPEPTGDISAIAAACQHFYRLSYSFLVADYAVHDFLQPQGTLDQFLLKHIPSGVDPVVGIGENFISVAPSRTPLDGWDPGATNAALREALPAELVVHSNGQHVTVHADDGSVRVNYPVCDGARRHASAHQSAAWYRYYKRSR